MANSKRRTTADTFEAATQVADTSTTSTDIEESGKTLVLKKVKNTSLFKWQWTGGGELPAMLSGMYTDPTKAEKAKANWERTKNAPSNSQ